MESTAITEKDKKRDYWNLIMITIFVIVLVSGFFISTLFWTPNAATMQKRFESKKFTITSYIDNQGNEEEKYQTEVKREIFGMGYSVLLTGHKVSDEQDGFMIFFCTSATEVENLKALLISKMNNPGDSDLLIPKESVLSNRGTTLYFGVKEHLSTFNGIIF